MLRFILLSALVAVAHCGGGASPRGGKGSPLFAFGGQAKGAGGGLGGLGSLGGGGGLGGLGGFGGGSLVGGSSAPQTIQAAVHSTRTITFNDVPYSASSAGPLNIEVGGSGGAINFLFKSSSSPINVDIEHSGGGGSYKETSSTEKPHHRIHTIIRPVIQELREIIQPTRLIKQTIEPVNEAVETIASKSQGGQAAAPAAPAVVPGGGYGSGAAGSGAAPGGGGYGSGAVQAPSAGGDYTQQQTTGWAAARA